MAIRNIFEEPLKERAKLPVEAFGVLPFAFPQKREDNKKRNIFEEPLFINSYAR